MNRREEGEQRALIDWANLHPWGPDLLAIPNGHALGHVLYGDAKEIAAALEQAKAFYSAFPASPVPDDGVGLPQASAEEVVAAIIRSAGEVWNACDLADLTAQLMGRLEYDKEYVLIPLPEKEENQ